MDYVLGFTLTFKCIFCYDFISIFFTNILYMIHDGKTHMDSKKLQINNLTNK
jgi:hypothetical protein